MENQTPSRKPVKLIIALVLLIIPIIIEGSWIYTASNDRFVTWDEIERVYLSHFPSYIHSIYVTFWIAFFFCFISLVLSILSLKKLHDRHRWLAYVALSVSVLVGFVILFQMM